MWPGVERVRGRLARRGRRQDLGQSQAQSAMIPAVHPISPLPRPGCKPVLDHMPVIRSDTARTEAVDAWRGFRSGTAMGWVVARVLRDSLQAPLRPQSERPEPTCVHSMSRTQRWAGRRRRNGTLRADDRARSSVGPRQALVAKSRVKSRIIPQRPVGPPPSHGSLQRRSFLIQVAGGRGQLEHDPMPFETPAPSPGTLRPVAALLLLGRHGIISDAVSAPHDFLVARARSAAGTSRNVVPAHPGGTSRVHASGPGHPTPSGWGRVPQTRFPSAGGVRAVGGLNSCPPTRRLSRQKCTPHAQDVHVETGRPGVSVQYRPVPGQCQAGPTPIR